MVAGGSLQSYPADAASLPDSNFVFFSLAVLVVRRLPEGISPVGRVVP